MTIKENILSLKLLFNVLADSIKKKKVLLTFATRMAQKFVSSSRIVRTAR